MKQKSDIPLTGNFLLDNSKKSFCAVDYRNPVKSSCTHSIHFHFELLKWTCKQSLVFVIGNVPASIYLQVFFNKYYKFSTLIIGYLYFHSY